MQITPQVRQIVDRYEGERPGVKTSLARLLMHGRLAGTGKLVILPVDQGFEHGPGRSFGSNPAAYDPHYIFDLALAAGLNGLAAPLGLLAAGADTFVGALPLILKANDADSLSAEKDQAITATVRDALELGCCAMGYTIYPGSDHQYGMFEEVREAIAEARAHGLAVIVWSYPRGGSLSPEGETALDVIAYSVQIAALLGAHIVKVKLPTAHIEQAEARGPYAAMGIDFSIPANRVAHVMQAALGGRRMVIFSGGAAKEQEVLLDEIRAIRDGGGNGSIMGRNSFQRPRQDALAMLDAVTQTYLSSGTQ